MTPSQQRRVAELFEEVVDLPPEERAAALRRLRGTEGPLLLEELRSLLEADAREGDLLVDLDPGAEGLQDAYAGPYRLVQKLGEGGMSEVYLGVREDGELRRKVAVKLVREELLTPSMIRRFETERQILANLEHPSIATLLDAGRTSSGRPFFVMELLDGEPIDRYCDARRLPLRARVELLKKVCSAVHYAHKNLVVHRDIKPSNLLVTPDGTPKLLDFGIAKLLDPKRGTGSAATTRRWERLLTPEYASPEQLQGRPVSTASDVYSLGVVLYRLLTGALPQGTAEAAGSRTAEPGEGTLPPSSRFGARRRSGPRREAGGADLRRRAADRCGSPGALARELAGDLDAITLRALRPEEDLRYASAEQLGEDLGRFLRAEPVLARRGGWRYRFNRLVKRQRLAAGLAVAICLLVLFTTALLAVQSLRLRDERNRARRERDRAREVTSFLHRLFEQGNPELGGSQELTVRDLLEHATGGLEKDLASQPERQADLRMTLAKAFSGMGAPQAGIPLVEEALQSRRRLYGEQDLQVAESLSLLGQLYRFTGESDRSARVQSQAREIFREQLGAASVESAGSQLELGLVAIYRRRAQQAVPLLEDALAVLRQSPAVPTDELADAFEALGIAYIGTSRFEEARALFEKGIALRDRGGSAEIEKANSQALLAAALTELGELDEAEELLLESLEIEDRILGPRQLNRPIRLSNLAALASRRRDHVRSEAYARRGLELARQLLPPNHLHTEQLVVGLALGLSQLGRHEEAEPLFRELVELRRQRLAGNDPAVAIAQVRLGLCLLRLARPEEAREALQLGLETLRRDPEGRSELLREALQGLIQIAETSGREEALPRLREELAALGGPPEELLGDS